MSIIWSPWLTLLQQRSLQDQVGFISPRTRTQIIIIINIIFPYLNLSLFIYFFPVLNWKKVIYFIIFMTIVVIVVVVIIIKWFSTHGGLKI